MIKEEIKLTIEHFKKDKDKYPASAFDKDSCFYNGQIGNCGTECPRFLSKSCDEYEEISKESEEELSKYEVIFSEAVQNDG